MGDVLAALAGLVADLLAGLLGVLMDLFIPSPGSWDFTALKDAFTSRPPGSLIADGGGLLSSVGEGWDGNAGTSCTSEVDGTQVEICPDNGPGSAYSVLYNLVRLALLITTGIYMFHVLREAIDR